MTDIEDKIRALLARASHENTPEEEARSCAVIAAKMMREHKIEIGAVSGPPPSSLFGRDPVDAGTTIRAAALSIFFEFMQAAMARAREPRPQPPPPPAPEPARTPFDEFWERYAKEHPTPTKPKRRHRRSKQSRKNNPNRDRKRRTK